MSQKIKMLCLWDYNTFTGFSTVSKNLVKNITNHFGNNIKIDICAVNYFGEDYFENENVHVISAKKKDIAKDDFGRYVFMRSLKDVEYDLIFILQDLGVIVPIIKLLKEIKKEKEVNGKKSFKSIFYFPVDFALTPNLGRDLEFFDFLATYTNYGKSHVLRLNKKVEKKLHVIPHGNNMDDFHPLPSDEISAFRKEYFGKNADKFIVTNINRNQSRKDIPTTIFGFLEYWDEYNKNSFLYLHLDPKDPMGWDIRTILAQTPLREGVDFMLPPEGEMSKGASVEKINKIYNASDVFLTTATGEGWGLSITEAMATKLPILAPNHTSIGEIAKHGERAYMLNTLYPIVAMVDNVIRFQSDLYEIAESLDIIYNNIKKQDPNHLQKVENAYQYVKSINWDWISKEFIKFIRSMNN
jgi:glycosyltransferase involved in cell wall biosynthesis